MFWRNLNIGLKACCLGLAIAIVTIGLSAVVISANNRLHTVINKLHDIKLQGVYYSGHLQAATSNHYRTLYGYVASAGAAGAEEKELFKQEVNEYMEMVRALELLQDEGKLLDQFASSWAAYLVEAEKIPALVRAGENAAAQELVTEEAALLFQQTNALLVDLINNKRSAAKYYFDASIADVANARANAIVIIASGVAFLMAVGIYITRSITRPVAELVTSAKRLSEGDLTTDIAVLSGDEVGRLAEAFRKMSQQLRDLLRQIGLKADLVAASAQELSASSEQATSVSTENSATMNQISLTVGDVVASVQQIAAAATNATTVAEAGEKSVSRVAEQMKSITGSTAEIGKAIAGLSKKSKDINQITNLITGIADQTNLLALNAAIEAARAGEQGRGFAVVADEVRKLAEQSAKAAGKINELILDIQAEAGEAVEKMEQNGKDVVAGTQIAQEAGLSFREITGAVSGLTERLREITAAANQMVSGIHSVAAASEEQSAAAEEVASSSTSLAVLAEELNTLLGRFKF
ncbi:MAG: Methyl-accepting chemotaxis protein McpB [Syntrophomonadaceae bacterium]|nr:Methyl-accepting chemotaxis protein McpB [Bacillota bacterium]